MHLGGSWEPIQGAGPAPELRALPYPLVGHPLGAIEHGTGPVQGERVRRAVRQQVIPGPQA